MRQVEEASGMNERKCVLKSDAAPLGKLKWMIRYSSIGEGDLSWESPADLMRLGLTCEEIADLEIREPLASEIAEYAGRYSGDLSALVDAVRTVLHWHIGDLDREIEMLMLRRRLLKRKLSAIRRLASALYEPEEARPAM